MRINVFYIYFSFYYFLNYLFFLCRSKFLSGNNSSINFRDHSLQCMLAGNSSSQLFVWKPLCCLKDIYIQYKIKLFRTLLPVFENHSIVFWFAGFLTRNVIVIFVFLYLMYLFHLADFKIFPFILIVTYLKIICLGVFIALSVCVSLIFIFLWLSSLFGFIDDLFHGFWKFLGN